MQATIDTNRGKIVLELFEKDTPKTSRKLREIG
jgi:cyclophilin family peptidyl-prolyl cis-trans isomerase